MKIIYAIIVLSITIGNAFSQQKLKTLPSSGGNKKTLMSSKSEIDRLADKYKETPSITLYTSHGDLDGNVSIEYNPDNKPQSIQITGRSLNKEAIMEFISNMIKQKYQQGYRVSDGKSGDDVTTILFFFSLGNYEDVRTFKKGNMYFIVKGGCCEKQNVTYKRGDKTISYEKISDYYWFSIETGDNSRKGGKKATKLDF